MFVEVLIENLKSREGNSRRLSYWEQKYFQRIRLAKRLLRKKRQGSCDDYFYQKGNLLLLYSLFIENLR